MNRAVSCKNENPVLLYIHERGVPVAPGRRELAKNLRCIRTEQFNSLEMRCVERPFLGEVPKMRAIPNQACGSVNPSAARTFARLSLFLCIGELQSFRLLMSAKDIERRYGISPEFLNILAYWLDRTYRPN
jgi:hypothetical protein